jgi:ABC-2 type transport system permease protein
MTTTTDATGTVPEIRKAGFGRLMLAEWTKIRSVRSTVWSLLLLIILDLGFTALFTGLTVGQWSHTDAEGRASVMADPAGTILGSGFFLGQLTVCVLGVMVVASEYSTGMIRASLLAVPRRLPMLAAKSVVFGLLIFVVGTAVSFGSFFIGAPILHSKAPVSLGAIIRHTAAGITGVIGFVLVLAPLAALLPGSIGKHVHAYLPSEAGHLIGQARQGPHDLLTPWQGYGVFAIWTAILLVIAAVQLKSRDA